jgi:hypothetical protein
MPDVFDALPLGTRVVVRYRLSGAGAPDGAEMPDGAAAPWLPADPPRFSDALGELLGVETIDGERVVRILTRRGEVRVPTAAITHAKPVPQAPAKRAPQRPRTD